MPLLSGYNPFANQDIFASRAFHEVLKELSTQGGDGEHAGISGAPFKRMVDGWLMAVALGAKMDLPPLDLASSDSVKFITGSVLQKDLGAIEFLMSIAVAQSGNAFIVEDSKGMMKIAQGFGELGFSELKEMATSGFLGATSNLARSLVKKLDSGLH